jgi:uncharacterized damage-inducible protein DinB
MKKTMTWLLFALLNLGTSISNAQQDTVKQSVLTSTEREYVIKFLAETESGVFDAVKNLTNAQLTFKPAANKWSIEECVKHIAASEINLWAMVDGSLKQPLNPDKRSGIKTTDEAFVRAVEDRSRKSTTFAALEPKNQPYKSLTEALAAFKENREKLINFMQTTQIDLRNHVSVLPIGTYDAYQLVLLISAHTNRHTQQIDEVKASASYPKG